jgi:hypothetical protein
MEPETKIRPPVEKKKKRKEKTQGVETILPFFEISPSFSKSNELRDT